MDSTRSRLESHDVYGAMDWLFALQGDVESALAARHLASQGHTVGEALANLREALELYFEDEALPEGLEPPIIATVELSA